MASSKSWIFHLLKMLRSGDFSDRFEKIAEEPFHLLQHLFNNPQDQERMCSLLPSPPLQNSDNATSKIDPCAFQAKEDKRKQSSVKAAKKNVNKRVCSNCDTSITTEWRRKPKGEEEKEAGFVCNACYCYARLKGSVRPKNMRKDIIKKRQREKKDSQCPKSTKKVLKKSPKKVPEVPVDQHQPNYSLPLDRQDEFWNCNSEINKSLELLIPDIGEELGTLNVYQRQYVPNYSLPPFESIQRKTSHQNLPYVMPEMGTHQQVDLNYKPEYNYRNDIYSLVSPNDIINVSSSVSDPSNGMLYTNC